MQFFTWRIFFDIFLLTLILYSLYRTLRMTGTWKIVIGLTSAGIVASVARFFDLQGVDWLFSNFSQIILLAFLIIFQPEIRRILERSIFLELFRRPFFFGSSRSTRRQLSVAQLIDMALFNLAERKWGALIVIPGKVPIDQWVTGGITIDATPSLPLLLSLFDSSSPGHDGAIILEDGRISRFGARLPLSQSNSLSENYGTRHHAAMGLAEKTDALVLLVSEERGVACYFKDGAMKRLASQGGAVKVMEDHLTHKTTHHRTLSKCKDCMFTALELGASLTVAVLFWSTLVQPRTETQEMRFTVPVEYSESEKNMRLLRGQTEATILLAGPQASLNRITPSSLPIKVNLNGLEPGKHRINITSDKIEIPRNLKLLQVQPDSLEVDLEHIIVREEKITPQFIGTLPEGLRLASVQVTPETLSLIDMRKSPKQNAVSLTTTPIYLENIRLSTTVYCKVIIPKDIQLEDRKLSDVAVQLTVIPAKPPL